jgi:hypothetical protein
MTLESSFYPNYCSGKLRAQFNALNNNRIEYGTVGQFSHMRQNASTLACLFGLIREKAGILIDTP